MQIDTRLHLVVMAGGNGTRFWPKSTSKNPKQFLSFLPDCTQNESSIGQHASLIAQTLSRFEGIVPEDQHYIVTTQALAQGVEDIIGSKKKHVSILAEPASRNTAPCIYWAARVVAEKDPHGVMIVMPSDHFIAQTEVFQERIKEASQWAFEHDDLVTLGVSPSRPETGYGYLKVGEAKRNFQIGKKIPNRVDAFIEKPNLMKANAFISSGSYLWNAGMFVWRAGVILEAFNQWMPEMQKAWEHSSSDLGRAYSLMPATSIDYGVMEKAKNVVTFSLECGWDDLGSWTSLETLADVLGAKKGNNVVMSKDILSLESQGNIVDAPGRLVALLGVEDLIIVEHGKSLLIARKDKAQEIRKVVEEVQKKWPDLV